MLLNKPKLSIIIPTKTTNSYGYMRLLLCIQHQDFPKDQLEVLPVTEGTSESAKAIGIKRAKGEVICIFASDNVFEIKEFLSILYQAALSNGAAFPAFYSLKVGFKALDNYFALIGGNDVLSYYMGKNDRGSWLGPSRASEPIIGKALGDNGFFVKKELIEKTDLENYYHVDNANEIDAVPMPVPVGVMHAAGDGLFNYFKKRYRYGLQHAFNKNRRWHLVDFKNRSDIARLIWFIFASVLLIPTLFLSIRGFLKKPDPAWFLHPIVCLATLFTYGTLMVHVCARTMFRSLFALTAAQRA